LDVFSLQAIPGGIGSILCGIFAGGEPYGLEGWSDRSKEDNLGIVFGGNGRLLGVQFLCVLVTAAECAVMTYLIMKIMEKTVGTDVTWEEEDQGLDKTQIGEVGYDYQSPQDTAPLDKKELATEFIQAAAYGNLSRCRNLLKAGADPLMTDYDGRTALHLAAAEGRFDMVKWLMMVPSEGGCGLSSNQKDTFGGTPLEDAFANGHVEVYEFLRQRGGTVDESKHTAMLLYAAYNNDAYVIKELVSLYQVDPNLVDYDKRTALHVAAASGNVEAVKVLMNLNATPFCKDRWLQSPLDEAKSKNFSACIDCFEDPSSIVHDTDIKPNTANKRSTEKGSPVEAATREMMDAASTGKLNVLTTLAKKGADCGCCDYDKRTPLHIAASNGFLDIIKFLALQNSCQINCCDRFGNTPLMEALQKGQKKAAELLQSLGGACTVDSKSGFVLCDAAAKGDIEQLSDLHLSGISLSTVDYDGRSALHLAACEGHLDTVCWLLKQGPEILNVVDAQGNTPLDDVIRIKNNSPGNDTQKYISIEEEIATAGGKTRVLLRRPMYNTLKPL